MVLRRPCAPKILQFFSQSRYAMWRHNEDNYLHIKIVKYLENEASFSLFSSMRNFAPEQEFFRIF
jgi:hypothetical protein